jgi:hypothetical protein
MLRHAVLWAIILTTGCGETTGDDGLTKFPTTDAVGLDQIAFPSPDSGTQEDGVATTDTSNPPTGCVNGEPCDDGDGCTENDTCQSGLCQGQPKKCDDGVACTTDTCSDDLCTFSVTPGSCFIDKVCYADEEQNPTNNCQRCASSLAKETWTVLPNGSTCDDGDPCSEGDSCVSGTCTGPSSLCPDDGNPCTDEVCEGQGCDSIPVPDGGACDDGDPCTVGDTCQAGNCTTGPEGKDSDGDGFYDMNCIGGNDCNDGSKDAHPGLVEVCDDGLDNDCDTLKDMEDADCSNPLPQGCTYHTDCYPERVCAVWNTTGQAVCSDPCAGDSDCSPGETCTNMPGSANVGFCQPAIPGGKNIGAGCQQGLECATGLCLAGTCAGMCLDQTHCLGGTCTLTGDPAAGYIGSACSKANNGALVPLGLACASGEEYSGDFCASAHCDLAPAAVGQLELSKCASLCKTRNDCGAKQECNITLYATAPAEGTVLYDPALENNPALISLTTPRDSATACFSVLVEPGQEDGNLPDGSPCQYNAQCGSRLCMALIPNDPTPYCTTLCAHDANCTPGMQCKLEMLNMTSSYLKHVGPLLGTPMQQDWWTYARVCKFE